MQVHESQIEDILATYPAVAKRVLGTTEDLRLIVRQMPLRSGRLDLLFANGTSLLLVELKVEPAIEPFVWQVKRYEEDLKDLQQNGELIVAPIQPVLLAPSFVGSSESLCREQGVLALAYKVDQVLEEFFQLLTPVTQFLAIRPKDYGLWNRHLAHRVLYALERTSRPSEIADATGLSLRSVMNHIRFAIDLHLVRRLSRAFELTDLGQEYVAARTPDMPASEVSDRQLEVLRGYIAKNPFGSPIFFGIYSLVEAVFNLARNVYPVPDDLSVGYFQRSVGKLFDWQTPRSARQGLRMYSNYAVELGLVARVGEDVFLTPDGLRFLLLLNLHKSIKMIDALGLGNGART